MGYGSRLSAPPRRQHTRQHTRQSPCATASSLTQTASVFPAGRTQARVKLPACILKVSATDVLQEQDFQEILSSVTAGGITGVLLSDTSGSNGAALYEAACKLKEQLRGRAVLLIADRTDIVDAAEADGVILSSQGAASHKCNQCSPLVCCACEARLLILFCCTCEANLHCLSVWRQVCLTIVSLLHNSALAIRSLLSINHDVRCGTGLPTVVARRMLQQGGLVGRVVSSGSDAVSAAAEGADLVFLEVYKPIQTHAIQHSPGCWDQKGRCCSC